MRERRLLFIGIILLLAIPLAVLLRDFVRDVFLVEVLRMFWGARMLYESLPQLPLWILLLVILVVIAVRSLGRRKRASQKRIEKKVENQGQVQVLARWIERTTKGEYFRWSLAQHLGGLTWEVMAHREHTTPAQLKQGMRSGRLDLPPVIQAYLQSARLPEHSIMTGLISRIRGRLGIATSAPSFDPALEKVVQFLEDQMEIAAPPNAGAQRSVGPWPEPEH